ncbi:MAG: hypothetical protein JO322_02790 [Candidatus Eremiobacteraeota bacterium]|nr:hypothetical protein [Candidatus Eremiobacteraeota bacterium]
MRRFSIVLSLVLIAATPIVLPNNWLVQPPPSEVAETGTMPQGMALSPDGSTIAVVEAGYNPAALSLYRVPSLERTATIALPGAFGRPVWNDAQHVLVAGGSADALLRVDTQTRAVERIAFPKGSYPIFVAAAPDGKTYAVATARDVSLRVGTLATIGTARAFRFGAQAGGIAFSNDGATIFVSLRPSNEIVAIDPVSSAIEHRAHTGLHPSALLVFGGKLYVAENDADAVGIFDTRDLRTIKDVSVRDRAPLDAIGVSPNSISAGEGAIFVTLGAANSVAILRNDELAGRMEAGWYPTDAIASRGRLYVLNGKGEGARPNPNYRPGSDRDYIGTIEVGSLRTYDLPSTFAMNGNPQGAQAWNDPAPASVLRPNGPIQHVFFVLKENRSYDQVLGDMPQGNGDAKLAWFGRRVTPNEHALAARFGLFDNAYTSGEVSATGHMWADAAFANDYLERFWPLVYANRGYSEDATQGDGPIPSSAGYIWDAARRALVSFRDYGELADPGKTPGSAWVPDVPSLKGILAPNYPGWNLRISDLERVKAWRKEFDAFIRSGTLPQFEFIWLPNDHTYGSKAKELTPSSYVAQNDYGFGEMIDAISHSPVWKSSVIFAIEDDAQDGPDHVSDQRTTVFVVSPFSSGGVRHEHYATVSILRTIEVLLGIQPLSTYDAMASPMYAAFSSTPDLRPYTVHPPAVDTSKRNLQTAYGAMQSASLDFSRPDAVEAAVLNGILAHNHE